MQPVLIQETTTTIKRKNHFPIWGYCVAGCGCLFIVFVIAAVFFGALLVSGIRLLFASISVTSFVDNVCNVKTSMSNLSVYLQNNTYSSSPLKNRVTDVYSDFKDCTELGNVTITNYDTLKNPEDQSPTFVGDVKFKNNTTRRGFFDLRYENNEWKIYDAHLV